jgi:hypothetical protein
MSDHHPMIPARGDEKSRMRHRVVAASLVGSASEWYDYALYGLALALVFNKLFFPALGWNLGTIALRARGVRELTGPEHFSPSGGALSAVRTAVHVSEADAHLPLTLSSNAAPQSRLCTHAAARFSASPGYVADGLSA